MDNDSSQLLFKGEKVCFWFWQNILVCVKYSPLSESGRGRVHPVMCCSDPSLTRNDG